MIQIWVEFIWAFVGVEYGITWVGRMEVTIICLDDE